MKKLIMAVIMSGLAGGAYAAGTVPGALEALRSGQFGVKAAGAGSADLAALIPAIVEDEGTLRLRAEAAADPDKFVDEHSPEEVTAAFGLFPSRFRITDPVRIQNAAVRLTVDLTRQRLVVQSAALNTEFIISSGVQGHRTGGSGKCFAPDSMEEMHYSSLYNNAPMPHSVFFNGNIAVHATSAANEALLGQPASHGCVRLSRADATIVFDLIRANGKSNAAICVQGAVPE